MLFITIIRLQTYHLIIYILPLSFPTVSWECRIWIDYFSLLTFYLHVYPDFFLEWSWVRLLHLWKLRWLLVSLLNFFHFFKKFFLNFKFITWIYSHVIYVFPVLAWIWSICHWFQYFKDNTIFTTGENSKFRVFQRLLDTLISHLT